MAAVTDRSSSAGSPPRRTSAASPTRLRARHPLLGVFPLAVMTLSTFLVVFAVLMARLQSGVDPALRAAASRSLAVPGAQRGALVTRTSGGGSAPAATSRAAEEGSTPVLTRTSGSGGGGESDDA